MTEEDLKQIRQIIREELNGRLGGVARPVHQVPVD
jgi:hypothetical protein